MRLIIEGGATRTTGVLVDESGRKLSHCSIGPTNLHVVSENTVTDNLQKLLSYFGKKPSEYHFYLSGLKTEKDRFRIRKICKKLGIKRRILLGPDFIAPLLKDSKDNTGIVVVSGTGSVVYGRNKYGKEIQVGGWGEKIGDEAGAYNIAIQGIKAAIRSLDGRGPKTILENKFGRIEKITDWIYDKTKTEIAGLAPVVFKAAEKGDTIALKIIDYAVCELVKSVNIVKEKIGEEEIILSGGNFFHQPLFRKRFYEKLNLGYLEPQVHIEDIIEKQREKISTVIKKTVNALRSGGRLFYVGAGTSGRIAVLDAVECRPTFNVSRNTVQAIIAGGNKALTQSIEGAEDNISLGRRGIRDKKINKNDIVVGISARGTTPFVGAALREAEKRKAYTVLITSGKKGKAKIVIRLDTGPEIIEGSTRLRAGTAAKMVLNMISTNSMIKLGKTFGRHMIDVRPTNDKLKKRAIGIICNICGLSEKESAVLLKEVHYNTRKAVRKGLLEKAGMLLMFGFDKNKIPEDTKNVIIFDKNVKYLSKLKNKNLFIAVDQEGGRVNRIKKGVAILPPMSEIKTEKEAYSNGAILAKELKPLGIKLDLAPVVDVNTEIKNPIIGDRSFGSNPLKVKKLSCAMIRGMQDNGLYACAKHFPGHGPTKKDSHKCLPEVNISYENWENIHLPPFVSAIKAGISCIMVGHILYPCLDKKYPSSLSHKIVTEILRKKLGYKGVIITDDILMKGITKKYTPEEAAVLAINAGADMVLVCKGKGVQRRIKEAIADAVLNGKIDIKRINESYKRVSNLLKGIK